MSTFIYISAYSHIACGTSVTKETINADTFEEAFIEIWTDGEEVNEEEVESMKEDLKEINYSEDGTVGVVDGQECQYILYKID